MSYFIKANFGRLTEFDGKELEMGVNTFKSFSLLQQAIGLSEGNDIILLDRRNTFDSTDYERGSNFYSGKFVDCCDICKAVGSVIIKNENNAADFYNFKDIQITAL